MKGELVDADSKSRPLGVRVRVLLQPSNIHLNIENYNFDLPEQLIAKVPIDERARVTYTMIN